MLMKLSALLVIAFALAACSPGDQERAREQARQDTEQLKRDSQKAFHEAEAETKKASRELNKDLDVAREKTRHALDQPAGGTETRTNKEHQ